MLLTVAVYFFRSKLFWCVSWNFSVCLIWFRGFSTECQRKCKFTFKAWNKCQYIVIQKICCCNNIITSSIEWNTCIQICDQDKQNKNECQLIILTPDVFCTHIFTYTQINGLSAIIWNIFFFLSCLDYLNHKHHLYLIYIYYISLTFWKKKYIYSN